MNQDVESFKDIDDDEIPTTNAPGYNKISISACNFVVDLISCQDNMDKLQQRAGFLLMLCMDEKYRDNWKDENLKLLDKAIEESKGGRIDEKETNIQAD